MASARRSTFTAPQFMPLAARNQQRFGAGFDVFSRTKMCKFNLRGACTKGKDCSFAHGKDELKERPDFYCTKICTAYFRTGTCEAEDKCKFAHSKDSLRVWTADNGNADNLKARSPVQQQHGITRSGINVGRAPGCITSRKLSKAGNVHGDNIVDMSRRFQENIADFGTRDMFSNNSMLEACGDDIVEMSCQLHENMVGYGEHDVFSNKHMLQGSGSTDADFSRRMSSSPLAETSLSTIKRESAPRIMNCNLNSSTAWSTAHVQLQKQVEEQHGVNVGRVYGCYACGKPSSPEQFHQNDIAGTRDGFSNKSSTLEGSDSTDADFSRRISSPSLTDTWLLPMKGESAPCNLNSSTVWSNADMLFQKQDEFRTGENQAEFANEDMRVYDQMGFSTERVLPVKNTFIQFGNDLNSMKRVNSAPGRFPVY
eukprot:TRINITY_DN3571_c0_g1_i1.p1 TRINITY_DN3571_c0_g1~~TRINITY_DN3571_c0_g1_i1.p1  ORF type:complete len:443 (+),score=71.18 TRINITY_DN3571_c0_g1_i1:54-1331(+)